MCNVPKNQETFYICVEKSDNTLVWGFGDSRSNARKDAIDHIHDFYRDDDCICDGGRPNINKDLLTLKTDREVIDYFDKNGGMNVPLEVNNGIASLIKHYRALKIL